MNAMVRILRAERRGPALLRADVFAAQRTAAQLLAAARDDANRLCDRARAEVARMREAAESQLERALGEAQARGYAEGTARAARELFDVAAMRTRALRDAEQQVEQAALLLAGKLLQGSVQAEPARMAALIAPLLARIRRAQRIRLHVHPDDAAALEPRLESVKARAEVEGCVELVLDHDISRGGCMVESDLGDLDARLETRLSELGRALGWDPP